MASLNKQLIAGLRVIDLAGEPLAMTGRLLADMGANVVKLEPPGGDPLRLRFPLDKQGESLRFYAWNAGKTCVEYHPDDVQQQALLKEADAVIETPGFPGALSLPRRVAPNAAWLQATPFGSTGPRAKWQASDLGILAACGNLHCTGDADRPPLRCLEPATYAHCAAEAAFALLTALASGKPQTIDLSLQEAMMIVNMGGAAQYPKTGRRGQRQGAWLGGTREIWPCRDGFVSFGLRGGPARAGNYTILLGALEENGLATQAWTERDWNSFNPHTLDAEELRAIEEPLLAYFARHRMSELYDLAVTTNLMLAPISSAAEILASKQLRERGLFAHSGRVENFPTRFFLTSDPGENATRADAPGAPKTIATKQAPHWPTREGAFRQSLSSGAAADTGAWSGLRILEFGSGAAGPIATRYFSEQGATVVRVESTKRPDFLRIMALNSDAGIEGSTLFDVLNPGKRSITLNLKDPTGVDLARQLAHWADAVVENFAPRAMQSWGLDYAQLCQDKPDLVMLSTCLNGQSGPHRDYPGFGGQGAALCGYNYLTGWPDREPVGPFGTITDSLSPRFAASALAAALLYRRRTGKGVYLDVSQVETGVYSLSPWILEHAINGNSRSRCGNHHPEAVPHGAFPCRGEDRWIAIACWNDQQWRALTELAQIAPQGMDTLVDRLKHQDAVERMLSTWTQEQDADALAAALQQIGVEAVPVADFHYLLHSDPQLRERGHFVELQRAITGKSVYEHNGFRLSETDSLIKAPTPLLGEHTEAILSECLGMNRSDIEALRANGVLS